MAEAALADADAQLDVALKKFAEARSASDSDDKKKLLAASRTTLQECRKRFISARDRIKALRASLAPLPDLPTNRRPTAAELQERELRARIEASFVECSPERSTRRFPDRPHLRCKIERFKSRLHRSEQSFSMESIANTAAIPKSVCKLTCGKGVQAELGDYDTAMDIYDEVLVMEPEETRGTESSAPFYSQVELLRLQLMIKRGKSADAKEDAAEWMANHKHWNRTGGYQGVALEYAKLVLAEAERPKLPNAAN